jgi:hypothetical protein
VHRAIQKRQRHDGGVRDQPMAAPGGSKLPFYIEPFESNQTREKKKRRQGLIFTNFDEFV